MPVLALNQPIEQREATLRVQNRLEPGAHRFSLVVVDARGVASEPDVLTVTVRRSSVVDPVRPPVVGPIDTVVVSPVVSPVVRPPVAPPVSPAVLTPVRPPIRSRVVPSPRKGKKHGPE